MNIGGAGARAMGMGGAFTAVCDDATATFYNPAGLVQLKRPEITLVGFHRNDSNSWSMQGEGGGVPVDASGDYYVENWSLNFGGLVWPLNPEGNNLVIACTAHKMVDDVERAEWADPGGPEKRHTWGGIYSVTLMGAYELNEILSFGLGTGYYFGRSSGRQETAEPGFTGHNWFTQEFNGGPQWVLGMLVKPRPRLKLGAKIKGESQVTFSSANMYAIEFSSITYASDQMDRFIIDLPIELAVGAAYRLGDSLTLATDYHVFLWSETEMRNAEGQVRGYGEGLSHDPEDSEQLHFGLEYLARLIENYPMPLRLGLYRYPVPGPSVIEKAVEDWFYVIDNVTREDEDGITYDAQPATRYYYTCGIGVVTADTVIDIAVEYSPLKESISHEGIVASGKNTVTKTYFSTVFKF